MIQESLVTLPEKSSKSSQSSICVKKLTKPIYGKLNETGETQLLTTDLEARMMRTKDGFACCYNVQTAVDRTSHLIAEYEVTNDCTDSNSLARMAKKAKETLGTETIHVGADKGYDDQDEIEKCILGGIIPHVGFKTDKTERLLLMAYEEATITEEDRAFTNPEDIQRCLKAGILPKRSIWWEQRNWWQQRRLDGLLFLQFSAQNKKNGQKTV